MSNASRWGEVFNAFRLNSSRDDMENRTIFFLKNAPEDFPRFLLIPWNFTMETKKPRSLYLGVMKTWRNTKIIFIFFHS